MQCLYCKKRLGLFASRKRRFCSESHEVTYHDEQSAMAMRHMMDPAFTAPVAPPAVRTTPELKPSPIEHQSKTPEASPQPAMLPPAPDPPLSDFKQERPEPAASNLAAAGVGGEVDLTAEPVHLPASSLGVLPFNRDSTELAEVAARRG
jgi:hypothetical protein